MDNKRDILLAKAIEALRKLPLEKFITVDELVGEAYCDWDSIDAADFKDHADEFVAAMTRAKIVLMEFEKLKQEESK